MTENNAPNLPALSTGQLESFVKKNSETIRKRLTERETKRAFNIPIRYVEE